MKEKKDGLIILPSGDKNKILGSEIIIHNDSGKKQSESMLSIIEKIALMPDTVATENLERLHKMHESMLDREAEKDFNQSFVKAQMKMPVIVKDSVNKQTHSKYAKLQKITRAIKPIYTDYGFGMIGGTEDSPIENCKRITIDLVHSSGHSKHYHYDIPIDDKGIKGSVNKTPTHAHGSSTTYATRYLKCLIWDIIIDEDDDGNHGECIDKRQVSELTDMINESGADLKKFLNVCGADSVDKIHKSKFQLAKVALMKKKK